MEISPLISYLEYPVLIDGSTMISGDQRWSVTKSATEAAKSAVGFILENSLK